MNAQPLVTIVTPSFNQGQFIEETIKSVVSQDYPNLEYLIIDGKSTDNSLQIIQEYSADHPCISWVSEQDEGQSDAINKGFRKARGEIVAWLNSDDIYEPGAIGKAVTCLGKNHDLSMVYGDSWIIDAAGKRVKQFDLTEPFDLWRLVHIWDYIMQPTVFMRRTNLVEAGYLRTDLNWTMDWDLWIRMAGTGNMQFVAESLACNRVYEQTKTRSGGLKRIGEIYRLMKAHTGAHLLPPRGFWIYFLDTCSELVGAGRPYNPLRRYLVTPIIKRIVNSRSPANGLSR